MVESIRNTCVEPWCGWPHSCNGGLAARPSRESREGTSLLYPSFCHPPAEQQAIAAVLDSVDDAIERTEAVIAAMERLRDALLHELLTRGVPGWHTEWKEAPGIGTIPASWDVKQLGDVIRLEYGVSLPEQKRLPGSIPVMGSAGIVGFHNQATVKGPGIVVGRKGSIGSVTWVPHSFVPIDTTYFVAPIEREVDLLWTYHLLAREGLARLNRATGVPGLHRDDVYALRRPIPSVNEQEVIATILKSIADLEERSRAQTEALRSLKTSAMDALLTGRVRVASEDDAKLDFKEH